MERLVAFGEINLLDARDLEVANSIVSLYIYTLFSLLQTANPAEYFTPVDGSHRFPAMNSVTVKLAA